MINIYIDTDVIVAAEMKDEQNHAESKKLMDYVLRQEHPDTTFITSVFSFLELASAMIRRTKNQHRTYSLLYQIKNSWKDSIKPVLPLPTKKLTSFSRLVDRLVETAIKFRTPSGDTIHAQTAAWHETDYLITWNTKHYSYMKKQLKSLKVMTPTKLLEELNKLYPEK